MDVVENWKEFDRLWDYSDPAASEARFRQLLPAAEADPDREARAELLTQIARAQGLQRRFDEARETLDQAAALIQDLIGRAQVRRLLETGRVHNSSGDREGSRPVFLQAWETARAGGHDLYAVDAAHMLAIVEPPEGQIEWSARAMELAESSPDPRVRKWLGPLYNNLGWTYHDMGRYEDALALFQKGVDWRREQGQPGPLRIAIYAVGRALRSLHRTEEALALQRQLLEEMKAAGEEDGYVHEEVAECLRLLGQTDEARPHFARAHALLSADSWLSANEPERLGRLAREAGVA
jgi:tetratricopeptide (TPR) repeat protein